MFTDTPLTAAALLARLSRYRFFDRATLPLGVARNALHAAKLVEQQRLDALGQDCDGESNESVVNKKRAPSLNVLKQPDSKALLEKIYSNSAVLFHFPQLWRDLLVVRPVPPLSTQLRLLRSSMPSRSKNNTGNSFTIDALYACLRLNLARKLFVPSFQLLDLAPADIPKRAVIGGGLGLTLIGLGSSFLWLNSPVIASVLLLFWLGLARTAMSLATPSYPLVKFDPLHTSLFYRLKHRHSLRMANMILTAFDETGSTTASNYHRRSHLPDAPEAINIEIDAELRRRNMLRREHLSNMELLYADYWSPHYQRWLNVEWQEPDQDPAELIEQDQHTRKPARKLLQ